MVNITTNIKTPGVYQHEKTVDTPPCGVYPVPMTLTVVGIIVLTVLSIVFINMALPNSLGGFLLSAVILVLGVGAAATYAHYQSTLTAIEMDCWDDESCAATEKGYIVTDPAAVR